MQADRSPSTPHDRPRRKNTAQALLEALRRADETVIGVITVLKDLTARKRAEANLVKIATPVEQSPVSVVITDTDGAIGCVNPYFTALTGYTLADSVLSILVVDDDDLLRDTVPQLLQFLGHQVAAVAGGRAALEHLAQTGLPDLVMLDLNMPDMTGVETLRHIRARFPELPVLLNSGYVERGIEMLVEADPHTLIIQKPFSIPEIQNKFREFGPLGQGGPAPGNPWPSSSWRTTPSMPCPLKASSRNGACPSASSASRPRRSWRRP